MPGTEPRSIGELPPVGELPKRVWAQVIRQDRFGEPQAAFRVEEVADAHGKMQRGVDVFGNRVALVGAHEPGLGRK
jgi:hypothetical protein